MRGARSNSGTSLRLVYSLVGTATNSAIGFNLEIMSSRSLFYFGPLELKSVSSFPLEFSLFSFPPSTKEGFSLP
jgi:hypothetical protein